MRDPFNTIVFGWYPYLALIVFVFGVWLRAAQTPIAWPGGVSEWLHGRQLMWGAGLALAGLLTIFAGHFVGLLTPIWIFEAIGISHGFKQQMAVAIGGVAGIVGFAGLAMLIYRVLFDAQIRAGFTLGERAILFLVFAQLALGLESIVMSLKYIDGCAMVKFMA